MHIYFLSKNPQEIASSLADKDLKRGIIDTTQILCTAFRQIEGNKEAERLGLYKSVYPRHEVTSWAVSRKGNFIWLWALGISLIAEFQDRFCSTHPAAEVLRNIPVPRSLKNSHMSPFPKTFPDQYCTEDIHISYRLFYCSEKLHNSKWTGKQKPAWMKEYGV